MISLILATYNGEKYIIDQLESIRNQSLQPDEVIIRDDCSTDRTREVVSNFITANGLNWNLICADTNSGWRENFYSAIGLCAGDIIFLCDQDDIWYPEKIESMVSVVESHPEIMLLASGYHSIYFDNVKRIDLPGDSGNDGSIEKVPFDKHFLSISYPGCTYCFRKSLKDEYLKYGSPKMAHDAQLWCFALQKDGLFILNRVLMDYLRHEGAQTATTKAHLDRQYFIFATKCRLEFVEKFLDKAYENNYTDERIKFLKRMKTWLEARIELYSSRNLFKVSGVLPYLSCYEKPKHFVRDIFLAVKK